MPVHWCQALPPSLSPLEFALGSASSENESFFGFQLVCDTVTCPEALMWLSALVFPSNAKQGLFYFCMKAGCLFIKRLACHFSSVSSLLSCTSGTRDEYP